MMIIIRGLCRRGTKLDHVASLNKVLAGQIRSIRKQQGLSQEQLAELAEVDRTYVGQIERSEANITLDIVDALALGLGLDACVLIGCGPNA